MAGLTSRSHITIGLAGLTAGQLRDRVLSTYRQMLKAAAVWPEADQRDFIRADVIRLFRKNSTFNFPVVQRWTTEKFYKKNPVRASGA
eukprot:SAG31_NODE_23993_length_491_cov_1.232143_1_plen_87_part_01